MLSVMKLNKENDKLKNNEFIQLTNPMNFSKLKILKKFARRRRQLQKILFFEDNLL
jgi:hypothetical protein